MAVVRPIAIIGVVTLRLDSDRLHTVIRFLVSVAARSLFGEPFLHLVPAIVAVAGVGPTTELAILAGIVLASVVEAYS